MVDPASVSDVGDDWRKMIRQLCDLYQTKVLSQEFRAFVDGLVLLFYLVDWAVSLELCMEAWEKDRQKIRLHWNVVWKANDKIRCRSRGPWVFRGAPPHVQSAVAALQDSSIGVLVWPVLASNKWTDEVASFGATAPVVIPANQVFFRRHREHVRGGPTSGQRLGGQLSAGGPGAPAATGEFFAVAEWLGCPLEKTYLGTGGSAG